MTLETIYADLLARWCDGLLALQLTDPATRNLRGGILCPACGVVHGRSTDALYPFLCMAHRTGSQKYLQAAILLQDLLDSLTDRDGGFISELSPAVEWKGCTVFSMVALAEALRYHGSILPDREREKWLRRLRTYSDYVYDNHTMETGDTNYPITTSLAMTLAGQILEDPRYTARGREFARASLAFFTEPNRLILGEGGPRPMTGTSSRGCRAVDLGCDWENLRAGNATGGALTTLWHGTAGPVLSASMTEYQPHEPTCMQRQREPDACLTARIEIDLDGRRYWSINDPKARVQTAERGGTRVLSVEGELADRDHGGPIGGRVPFRLGYAFSETEVLITVSVSGLPAGGRVRYVLPVIAANDEDADQPDGHTLTVSRPGGTLRVSASQPAIRKTKGRDRVFNVVPGFETVPLVFTLDGSRELRITLTFREA